MLAAAAHYAEAFGWRCFPVCPDKSPATPHGFCDAIEDPNKLRRLLGHARAFAAACGPSLLTVIDIDTKHGVNGFDSWRALTAGKDVPNTATASTPNDGQHLYFRSPELREIPCSTGKLGPGLDVRADGGYIILPPSRVRDGAYTWLRPPSTGIADLPAWLIGLLATPEVATAANWQRLPVDPRADLNAYFRAALRNAAEEVSGAQPGARNDVLNRAAYGLGRLVPSGLAEDIAIGVLLNAALSVGLKEREARRTIKSGMLKGQQAPREVAA